MIIEKTRLYVCPGTLYMRHYGLVGVAHFVSGEMASRYLGVTPGTCPKCSGAPRLYEVVSEHLVAVYLLGGADAVVKTWHTSTEHLSAMDFFYLKGDLPSKFRLTDGSADGYELTEGGWVRVFFPPLDWPKVDWEDLGRRI